MTGPPVSGGCLFCGLLGGCLLGEADPHQSRSATHSLALLQRRLEGKRSQGLGAAAWLAFGKRITCPHEGAGSHLSVPRPFDQHGRAEATLVVPHLSLFSWGQVPTNLSTGKKNHPIMYLSFTWCWGQGGGAEIKENNKVIQNPSANTYLIQPCN